VYIVKQNKNNSRIFTKNFVDFQNFQKFNDDRILTNKQTDKQTPRQAKFIYRLFKLNLNISLNSVNNVKLN